MNTQTVKKRSILDLPWEARGYALALIGRILAVVPSGDAIWAVGAASFPLGVALADCGFNVVCTGNDPDQMTSSKQGPTYFLSDPFYSPENIQKSEVLACGVPSVACHSGVIENLSFREAIEMMKSMSLIADRVIFLGMSPEFQTNHPGDVTGLEWSRPSGELVEICSRAGFRAVHVENCGESYGHVLVDVKRVPA